MYKKLLYCVLAVACVLALVTYSEEAEDIAPGESAKDLASAAEVHSAPLSEKAKAPLATAADESAAVVSTVPAVTTVATPEAAPMAAMSPAAGLTLIASTSQKSSEALATPPLDLSGVVAETKMEPKTEPTKSQTFAQSMGLGLISTGTPPVASVPVASSVTPIPAAPMQAAMESSLSGPSESGVSSCEVVCSKVCDALKKEAANELEETAPSQATKK